MNRRMFVRSFGAAPLIGITGCLGDDGEDDELVGEGRLRLRNQSGQSLVLEYGLLEEGTALEDANLHSQELVLDGDEAEIVYRDVTGGPYRFVVTAPNRDWQPVEHPWRLEDCTDLTVGVTGLSDAINISSTRCVVGPDRR